MIMPKPTNLSNTIYVGVGIVNYFISLVTAKPFSWIIRARNIVFEREGGGTN